MGRKRPRVNNIREIIRDRQKTYLSERQVARALVVSRTVVARTLQVYHASGLAWSEVPSLADCVLQHLLTLGELDTASRLILLESLEDRHGRAASLLTSQLPVSQWHTTIGEATIADAICERIVHTAHRLEKIGESVRKLYAARDEVKSKLAQPEKRTPASR